jgi:hypothetical protein
VVYWGQGWGWTLGSEMEVILTSRAWKMQNSPAGKVSWPPGGILAANVCTWSLFFWRASKDTTPEERFRNTQLLSRGCTTRTRRKHMLKWNSCCSWTSNFAGSLTQAIRVNVYWQANHEDTDAHLPRYIVKVCQRSREISWDLLFDVPLQWWSRREGWMIFSWWSKFWSICLIGFVRYRMA